MVERTAALRAHYELDAYAHEIKSYRHGSFFKAINAKASTQDGLNPQAFVLDELHAHKSHDLLNVLTSAAGGRRNPLFLYTTTEGFETPGPWPETRAFAQNVLRGIQADHFLAVYYSLDDEDKQLGVPKEDDDFDESKWIKANPLFASNDLLLPKLREMAIEAKQMPGKLPEFRTKRLNRSSSAAKVWIDLAKWKKCGGKLDLEWLVGYPCWGAFDLASTTDMASWCLLWYVEGVWYVLVRYFVPEEAARRRKERQSAGYYGWIESGWIVATEGDAIDYDVIRKTMLEDIATFQPSKIAYDPWNAQQFVTGLTNRRDRASCVYQGARSYNPAMQALEIAYTKGKLRHGGNPVLQWNAANLVPEVRREHESSAE